MAATGPELTDVDADAFICLVRRANLIPYLIYGSPPDLSIQQKISRYYLSFAEAVVDFWMYSPKHRDNTLAREAQQMGCGAAFYWDEQGFPKFKTVQVFQWFEPVRRKGL